MFDAQTLTVLAIVAAAAGYLLRSAIQFLNGSGKTACGNCSSKGACSPADKVVQINIHSPKQ
jgi:hypothetical protein